MAHEEGNMAYRYRWNGGTTAGARERFDRVLAKIGSVRSVTGYRFVGRFQTQHEAVLVRGENGTARFRGLLWGYGGDAPKATVELLVKLGIHRERAEHIVFNTERSYPYTGPDFHIAFLPNHKLLVLRREQIAELAKDAVTTRLLGLPKAVKAAKRAGA
jgi:hypothetical protein